MEIGNYKKIRIEELKTYDRNSRTHPTEQIEQIKKSILEFGFTNPLLVNEKNEIIAGHGRLEAVKQLNKVDFKDNPIIEIPCIEISGLNEAQYKALVIADNKIAENAGWNFEILKEEIQSLELLNYDIDLLGFDDSELIEIVGEQEAIQEREITEGDLPVVREAKRIKQGDLIELGNHRILCGDSTKKEDIEKLMGGIKADMVLSDPPYGISYKTNHRKNKNHDFCSEIKNDKNLDFLPFFIENSLLNLKENSPFYIFCSHHNIDEFIRIAKEKLIFKHILVWVKNNWTAGDLKGNYATQTEFILFSTKGKVEFTQKRPSNVLIYDRVVR